MRQVQQYIYSNRLKPGDRLPPECDLAKQLQVSRPTLREALRGLAVSGLVEARPRSGTRVREFAYEQVVDALVAADIERRLGDGAAPPPAADDDE